MDPKEMNSEPLKEKNADLQSEITQENAPNEVTETPKVTTVEETKTTEEKAEPNEPVLATGTNEAEANSEEEVPLENEDKAAASVQTSEQKEVQAEETVEVPEESEKATEVKTDETTEKTNKEEQQEETVEAKTEEVEEETKVIEKKQEVDYSKLSQVELINAFRQLLDDGSFSVLSSVGDLIKLNFYKRLKAEQAEKKKIFIEQGGAEEDFKVELNPYEIDLKDLMKKYRQLKFEHAKGLEQEKDKNLELKYQLIEEIKSLINAEESINKTFHDFKELQQKWREIGPVPQAKMKDLWDTYHHHVENFYDYIKINKELRDLDLKKNLELKITLCEKAEALLLEASVLKAFNTLQKFHEQWREIGPVPRDKKEEIWERFKDATRQINKKHQDYFENRKKSQKKNLDAKTALCEKAEEFSTIEFNSPKDWEDKSKELVELQKYWRTIGFAPKKENNDIYERFRSACDGFFDKKREFYGKHKEEQSNNLQMKIDLCIQAEALKDSNEWKKTTDEFINIQKKWKEIGSVPRKHSDSIWKRFRGACDHFFEQKSNFFNNVDEEQVKNLALKNDLVAQVENYQPEGDDDKDFNILRDFQRQWTEIGHVPIKQKNEVQKKFRDAINSQFDKLRIEDKERNLLKFKNKTEEWGSSDRGRNKMNAERDKFAGKLKQLENDVIILKNNIGFFANSKNAESLIEDVKRKIIRAEEQIIYIKNKIRIIDSSEYED